MDGTFKEFLESGRKLLGDTKLPRQKPTAKAKDPAKMDEHPGDSHQVFVKRTISELPKKSEIVEEIKKFVAVAEKDI
jgi:hypothetical protein